MFLLKQVAAHSCFSNPPSEEEPVQHSFLFLSIAIYIVWHLICAVLPGTANALALLVLASFSFSNENS